jgi:hypothetical protein
MHVEILVSYYPCLKKRWYTHVPKLNPVWPYTTSTKIFKTYTPRRLPAPQFQIESPVSSMSMTPFWRPATASSSAMNCTLKFGAMSSSCRKSCPNLLTYMCHQLQGWILKCTVFGEGDGNSRGWYMFQVSTCWYFGRQISWFRGLRWLFYSTAMSHVAVCLCSLFFTQSSTKKFCRRKSAFLEGTKFRTSFSSPTTSFLWATCWYVYHTSLYLYSLSWQLLRVLDLVRGKHL